MKNPFRSLLGTAVLSASLLAPTAWAQTPKVPEVKEAPKPKAPPKVPTVKEAPKAPEVKAPPKAPSVPKVPTVKAPPKVPKVPTIKEPPKVPTVKAPPKIPTVKEPPKVPTAPKVPVVKEAPKVPTAPKVPVVKEAPKVPTAPKVPVVKEAPKVPDAPKAPVVKKAPEVPKVATVKDASKVPKTTEVKAPTIVKVEEPRSTKGTTPPKAPVTVVRENSAPENSLPITAPPSKGAGTVNPGGGKAAENSAPKTVVKSTPNAESGSTRKSQAKKPEDKNTSPRDRIAGRREGKKDADEGAPSTPAEERAVLVETVDDGLQSVGLRADAAKKIAVSIADGDTEAVSTAQLVTRAGGIMQLVGADSALTEKVVAEIADRKLTDATPGGAADNVAGRAVLVVLVGERAKKINPAFLNEKAGRLARAVLDSRAAVEVVGLDPASPLGREIEEEILTRGLIGEEARAVSRDKLQPIVDAARVVDSKDLVAGVVPGGPGAPVNNNNLPSNPDPSAGPGPGGPGGPGPNNDVGIGPGGKGMDDGSGRGNGSGKGTGTGTGSGTGDSGTGTGAGSGGEGGSGGGEGGGENDDKGDSNISHHVVTDQATGKVISEFDIDITTGEIVKVYKSGTPNPLKNGERDPTALSQATGGRLGAQEARTALKGVNLAAGGGGTAGPTNPEETGASGILFTPEEKANAERNLRTAGNGGATDPTGIDENTIAATARDLKDLHLKGNGGAKGPTDSDAPTAPDQDPNSPLQGAAPVAPPSTKINSNINAAGAVQIDSAVSEQIKAGVQQP